MPTQKGFTLIELMIVVAIVSILSMVAVPMYSKYIERSRDTATQSLLQQISLAEISSQTDGIAAGSNSDYVYITSVNDYDKVDKMVEYGFRPDSNVGFAVYRSKNESGFVAVAGHRAKLSNVYVYDNIGGTGVAPYVSGRNYQTDPVVDNKLYIFMMDPSATTPKTEGVGATITFDLTNGKVN